MSKSNNRSIIQSTLQKDYKDIEFISLMKDVITESIESNKFYGDMVKESGFNVDDLNNINDLELIPYIPTTYYKESANNFRKLLKIPEEKLQHWNCSSTTTGDPSLVGVNEKDMNFLYEMSRKSFLDFIPRDWDNTKVFLFSPDTTMLTRFCFRYTKVRPIKAYSSNFYAVSEEMLKLKVKYLFTFSISKTLKSIIKTHKIVGGFFIKQTEFIEDIEKNLKKPEEERFNIGIGGSNALIKSTMNLMKLEKVSFNLGDNVDVVLGGGGWDGHKGQMKIDPIDKVEFVSQISELFGTTGKRVIDLYGFTENPILFGSHWSDKHEDFVFHCPHYSRIIIREILSREPLKKEGDRGFLEVLTPFGSTASVRHAVTVDDYVELVSKHKCPECGFEGDTFKVLGRLEDKDGLGCSSIIQWV